ncbi:TIGR03750 family conjugal transfer protein [Alloalcanivorax xenomutans]|uniref:Conjugative transfer region protein, TIGR03750 family n=1 Tax=Alcanivorax xiamenensis TaxID=1177156 RepID=A0ABQ6Y587_9GAMM|nr:TIGR03750 family conjugal transfer protein [Alcanivorax xiamenensis]KAF0804390.1 hypothetical protein A6D6_03127 [Alcanivorax xiamenensis]
MATPTITFLPSRLNQAPVVFRGMTGREVALAAGAGVAVGLIPGIVAAFALGIAMVPTCGALGAGAVVWFGGGVLRRLRRGRPETWLYRRIAWSLALRGFASRHRFITQSAIYGTRRHAAVRSKHRTHPSQSTQKNRKGV